MYYYKPPQSVGQDMPQDNFYLLSKPATCTAAWTLIDDTDAENGCLRVVRGAQKAKILCLPKEGQANPIAEMVESRKLFRSVWSGGKPCFPAVS
ncbi:hypothetical protein CMK14_25255 [Candidatus Poribacteria bacterium]|nr:hypothetical protein [Candidatus Poribacteria bacterium]